MKLNTDMDIQHTVEDVVELNDWLDYYAHVSNKDNVGGYKMRCDKCAFLKEVLTISWVGNFYTCKLKGVMAEPDCRFFKEMEEDPVMRIINAPSEEDKK